MNARAPISKRQRFWAAFIAVMAIAQMVTAPTTANALLMCGLLLFAWREAFYVTPLTRLRMKDIYTGYREGRFTSDRTGRLVSAAAVVLMVAGFVVKWTT